MCLYVDDMIYMCSCESLIAEFKSFMMKNIEMTDLGLLHYFLGLENCHDPSLGPRRDMANEEPEGTPNKPLKLVITLHRSRKYIQH